MGKIQQRVEEISAAAWERIKRNALMPTPENYEICYLYYAKSNADITRALDMLEAQNQALTNEVCEEIYQKFLTNEHESASVRSAGSEIQKTIKDVSTMVDDVKHVAHEYTENIASATDKLGNELDRDALDAVLNDIRENTSNMVSRNQALEQKLQDSMEVMVEMQRNLEIVRKEALTDGLTNLANRKAFDKEVKRLIQCVKDKEIKTFSLILMDIDHFKLFNDTYGHQIGDQVLKLVSRTLFNGLKGQDMAARYGGEEFAVLLPDTALQFATRVGNNLREAIATKEVVNRSTGEKLANITLSGGVAEYRKKETLEDLVERADEGLYMAKNNGRNRMLAASAFSSDKKMASK